MKDIKILSFVLIGNVLLVIVKVFGGVYGHSASLIADGLHSAADVLATVLVLFAVKISLAPPDTEHPYGHGKIEPLAATGSAVFLGLIAFEIAYSSIERIVSLKYGVPDALTAWIAVISIASNEIMFRIENRYGEKQGSAAIVANAWDNRSDALASFAAFVGILLSRLGYPILDPISALIIAMMILRVAYRLIIKSSMEIMDSSIPEIESNIIKFSEKINGVEHAFARARRIGRNIHIDLKLEMDPLMTVSESHRLGQKAKKEISSHFADIEQVMIHVHPHDTI